MAGYVALDCIHLSLLFLSVHHPSNRTWESDDHQWKQTWRVKLTPVCDPLPIPKTPSDHFALTPAKTWADKHWLPPPSPDSCCLPGLVCCGLPWPWTARPVQGLELETWHNSLARRGQMKGKNRRVMGRLHMNRWGNGEGRSGVRGWRVKVNPLHHRVLHRPLPNWRADKGDDEGVRDDTGRWALGPLPPAPPPGGRRESRGLGN